ncbi:hypothetical protein BDR07DRAFT_1377649 [Suillus spraguei]|nr:hypothetical protein BDR07DRAFT_1377649 [Suillus spraguei]
MSQYQFIINVQYPSLALTEVEGGVGIKGNLFNSSPSQMWRQPQSQAGITGVDDAVYYRAVQNVSSGLCLAWDVEAMQVFMSPDSAFKWTVHYNETTNQVGLQVPQETTPGYYPTLILKENRTMTRLNDCQPQERAEGNIHQRGAVDREVQPRMNLYLKDFN